MTICSVKVRYCAIVARCASASATIALRRCDARREHVGQRVELVAVESRHREVEGIGAHDDLAERVALGDGERDPAGLGDAVDLALGVRALALGPHLFDQALASPSA